MSTLASASKAVDPIKPIGGRHSISGYFPTLDGWRAIAVMSVIFTHDTVRKIGPLNSIWLYDHGGLGVDVFFAISGILICSRLLQEERVRGRISLTSFYIRRAFRILPPAVLLLTVLALLGLANIYPVQPGEWFGALFFYRNYSSLLRIAPNSNIYFSAHFWSLSVEEHFYLLLPAVLVLTPRKFRIAVLSIIAISVVVHRNFEAQHRPMELIGFHTDIRLDALLFPAIYAVVLASSQLGQFQRAWFRFSPLLAIPLLWAIVTLGETPLKFTIVSILMPVILIGTVLNPQTFFARALELTPIRFVGRISYSLYLWQQLFFTSHFGRGALPAVGTLQSWLCLITLTFACAMASYYLLERPMIAIGHHLAPPTTPGR